MRISDWSSDVCSSDLARPLNPCAITHHSDDSLRLAGGLACLTAVKLRLSSATRSLSAPPASTLATNAPPGRRTSAANHDPAPTSAIVRRASVCWWPTVFAAMTDHTYSGAPPTASVSNDQPTIRSGQKVNVYVE